MTQLQWRYGSYLHFINYIGMMEPAYYAYLPGELGSRPYLDWHFHGLVWGVNASKLERQRDAIRNDFASFVPGVTPADVRPINPRGLRQVIWYVNKSPYEQLAVSRRPQLSRNRFSYRQGAAALSGVNAVRLYAQTRDRYIDSLSLAGGEGSGLLAEIKSCALRRFREARRAGKNFISGF